MQAVLRIELLLPSVDTPQHLLCILLRKRLQRIQSFPVFRQSYRHHRHTLQMRQICRQIRDAPLQFRSVVDAFAQNDLPVHRDPGLIQLPHLQKRLPGKPVI